jgi:serine/threonine protein kinase
VLKSGIFDTAMTTMPSTIGHYTLTSKLGEGGMGEVYRATDTRLGREVAVKVLPAAVAGDPERLARFKREARVLASLNHPNIATIFGVEDEALVMELIEGDTLSERIKRGAIPVEESVRIAQEIGAALEYAHQHGVIHRDLKPANVKAAERVKVLDFGLAKMQEVAADASGDATITGATQAGMILGTAAYMSPEQASGRPVDARSDIFSFGVLLYEMLSGRRAFSEDTPISTMGAILHKEPKPLHEIAPEVPAELEAVVVRCMAKKPAERFQSMPEVREALKKAPGRAAAAAAEPEGPSLAVLPFANLSADKENEYFSDGLAEEILIALGQVKGLRVAARSSSFSFKGKQADASEIGAKLNVGHVLEGSVRRAGNRVRVTVQLVDARKCFPLWSERYDRQMEDIFEVQDEIARAIAAQLQVTLGAGVKQATQNVEAYELYLKGRHYLYQRLASTMRLAMQCFEQAIRLDADFALPYAGLTDCYAILRVYGYIRHSEGQGPALAAVTKAKALEPNSWEVNVSEGLYDFYFGKWQESGAHFERAVQLNPRSSLAHGYLAIYLAMSRKRDEAMSHAHASYRVDPLNPLAYALAACTFQLLYDPAAGIPLTEKALELQPDFLFGLWMKGLLLTELDRDEQAVPALERVVGISRAPIFLALLAMGYARAGRKEDALRLLRELEERRERGEFVSAWSPGGAMTELGDLDGLRHALQEAWRESNPAFGIRLLTTHKLDEYRSDAEINRLLTQFFGY